MTTWTRDELQVIADQVIRSDESLRSALARELHHELGGVLTGLALDLSHIKARIEQDNKAAAEAMESARGLLAEAVAIKRSFIEKLYPSVLHLLGLCPALELLASEFARLRGAEAQIHLDSPPEGMASELCIDLYRLAQAAFTDLAAYTHVSQVSIRFVPNGNEVELEVGASGQPAPAKIPATAAVADPVINYRIRRWGGRITTSAPAAGQYLMKAVVPVAAHAATVP